MPAANQQFRALAGRLSFGEPLDATRADARLVAGLREGQVLDQGHRIALDQWADPPGLPAAALGHWHFVYHSLAWLDPLRRQSLATGDAALLRVERRHLRRLLAEFGPPPAERSPHPDQGFAWADMASAWRTMVLIGFASAAGPRPWLVAALGTHLEALLDPAGYGGRGNHALHHCNALASVALLLGRRDALAVAQDRLAALRAASFDDQGVSLEGSSAYHVLNIDWWRDAIRRQAIIAGHGESPVPPPPDGRAFLQDLIADDGRLVPIGDSGFQKRTAAAWLRSRFGGEEAERLLAPLPATLDPALIGESEAGRLSAWRDGYGFSRRIGEGGAPSFATLRFGPGFLARPHAHEDVGAVTFYAGGERWIEEGGTYGYRGGDFRRYCRSQAAHNTVIVAGARYRRDVGGELLDAAFGEEASRLAVAIEETLTGCRWRRAIEHRGDPPALIVHDVVRSARGEGVECVWNLATGAEIVAWSDARIDVALGEARAVLLFAGSPGVNAHHFGAEAPLRGWRCMTRTSAVPIHAVWRRIEAGEAIIATAIVALPEGVGFADVAVERVEADEAGFDLALRFGDRRLESKRGAG